MGRKKARTLTVAAAIASSIAEDDHDEAPRHTPVARNDHAQLSVLETVVARREDGHRDEQKHA